MSSMLGPSIIGREQAVPRTMVAAALLALGLVVMFAPVFTKLAHTVWNTDEQGHGPIILTVVAWLLWRRRERFSAALSSSRTPAGAGGWSVLVFGLCLYTLGRMQSILAFEVGAFIPLLTGALAVTFGWRIVRI